MAHFPDMRAHKERRDVMLLFDEGVGLAIRKASEEDGGEGGVHLVKAARTVRRGMLNMNSSRFVGSFEEGCQGVSIPKSLLVFVGAVWFLMVPVLRRIHTQHHKQH